MAVTPRKMCQPFSLVRHSLFLVVLLLLAHGIQASLSPRSNFLASQGARPKDIGMKLNNLYVKFQKGLVKANKEARQEEHGKNFEGKMKAAVASHKQRKFSIAGMAKYLIDFVEVERYIEDAIKRLDMGQPTAVKIIESLLKEKTHDFARADSKLESYLLCMRLEYQLTITNVAKVVLRKVHGLLVAAHNSVASNTESVDVGREDSSTTFMSSKNDLNLPVGPIKAAL